MVDTPNDAVTTPAVPAAPVADTVVTPVATETPVAVTATETPVVESKPAVETPSEVDSVLSAEKPVEVKTEVPTEKKDEIKTEGDKPKDEKVEKPAEVKTDVKVELPVYDEFKLPENITLDKEPLDAFTKILGEIETGKLDHKSMQEKGQALIDLAAKATTDSITRLNDYYVQIHNDNKKVRFEALKADPEMGGDKLADTIATLQETVANFGGTEAQIAEFRKEVKEAGIDASPALCRLINNMQKEINKYTKEQPNAIVPGAKPAPSKVKDYQRFYSGNG